MEPEPPATIQDLESVFSSIISSLLGLAGIALFIMLIVGGFMYATAGSDPKRAEGAKKTLTYAIIGIVFISLAFLFLQAISWFTGVDVTTFTLFQSQ
jgi:TRAP-type C4-dicarboxylate transport system permease small subunit